MAELILNADDYGHSPIVNNAIEHLAVAGRISSFTLLANFEGTAEVTKVAAKLGGKCSIGLHVNLTEGWPVLKSSQVPSLVGPNGEFLPAAAFARRLLTGRIRFRELYSEILAQIEAIQEWLGAFSHFDSHHHVHRFLPVTKAIIAAATVSGAPRRIRTTRRYLADAQGDKASFLRLWCRHLRTHPAALVGLYFKARQEYLRRVSHFTSPDYLLTTVPAIQPMPVAHASDCWARVFQRLGENRYELNCHPGRNQGEDTLLRSSSFERALRAVRSVSYHAVSD